ncbi:hypothetical protein B0H10DRAFT_1806095, partial [Mycena sp. CBHHK59/15]
VPLLHSYSLTTQFLILAALLTLSYLYRGVRISLVTLISLYTVFKVTPPLVRWGYSIFKAIAMFGFYVNFFIVGVGYIFTGAVAVWNAPELLKTFVDSLDGK